MKKNCLFLGYSKHETRLISFIESKGYKLKRFSRIPSIKYFKSADLIISFGFRHIIKKFVIDKCAVPIINIHLSYLPFNRGAHPNFWSFVENTPSGFSIHEIDENIDKGKIIYRKKIYLNFKKKKFSTFKKTYKYLFYRAECYFIKNFAVIETYSYKPYKLKEKKGSFHLKKQLPNFVSWNMKISIARKKFDLSKFSN